MTLYTPEPEIPPLFMDSSALLTGFASTQGASHKLLVLGQHGLIKLIVMPYILNEVLKNLYKKFPEAVPQYELMDRENA